LLPNGKVLVAGGLESGFNPSASAELYDPASGTWTATASLNTARYAHTATLLPNGKVLVAGGYNGSFLTSAELYDPASGTWTTTGSLNSARDLHTATLLPNGKVLVAGGYNGSFLTGAELFDPAGGTNGTWTTTGSLNSARDLHTATLLPNGMVLVAGGLDSSGGSSASAELFDPAGGTNGTWTATASLNTAREQHTATLLPNGKVLVAGGFNGSAASTSAELFDPAGGTNGTWTATSSLNRTLLAHGDLVAQRQGASCRGI
jgi:deoxycytidylate deaminase